MGECRGRQNYGGDQKFRADKPEKFKNAKSSKRKRALVTEVHFSKLPILTQSRLNLF